MTQLDVSTVGEGTKLYSLPRKIAAVMRGLRRPCMTATIHNGVCRVHKL